MINYAEISDISEKIVDEVVGATEIRDDRGRGLYLYAYYGLLGDPERIDAAVRMVNERIDSPKEILDRIDDKIAVELSS